MALISITEGVNLAMPFRGSEAITKVLLEGGVDIDVRRGYALEETDHGTEAIVPLDCGATPYIVS